jgi:hypothetical protein
MVEKKTREDKTTHLFFDTNTYTPTSWANYSCHFGLAVIVFWEKRVISCHLALVCIEIHAVSGLSSIFPCLSISINHKEMYFHLSPTLTFYIYIFYATPKPYG